MQDVIPPKKRSIRDIPLPKGRPTINSIKSSNRRGESTSTQVLENEASVVRKGSTVKKVFYTLLLFVIAFILLFTFVFSSAQIDVKPKIQNLAFNANFIADSSRAMPYNVSKFEVTKSKSLKYTGEKEVKEKAHGKITIYNNYNSSTQRLIKNTRFESPDGLIYRIQKSVNVPGMKGDNPGKVEVEVYADAYGESYNIGLTNFTIPGFKGTDRFNGFYAKSKTDMAGGFVGVRGTVSSEDIQKAENELDLEVKDQLLIELDKGNLSDVVYQDALFVKYDDLVTTYGDESVVLSKRGVLNVVSFDRAKLSRYIADIVLNEDSDTLSGIDIDNIDKLVFDIKNKNNLDIENINSFIFGLKGEAKFVYFVNTNQLKADLAGKGKESFDSILKNYKNVDTAVYTIKPFWVSKFPSNIEKINITVER